MRANLQAMLEMPESFTSHQLAEKTGWISESARMLLRRYVKAGLVSMVDVPHTHTIKRNKPSTGYMRYYSLTDKGHEVIAHRAAVMTVPPAKGISPVATSKPKRMVNSVFALGQL